MFLRRTVKAPHSARRTTCRAPSPYASPRLNATILEPALLPDWTAGRGNQDLTGRGACHPGGGVRGGIVFIALDGTMMSAGVDVESSVQAPTPAPLFPSGLEGVIDFRPYDVSRDGQRFLIPVFKEVPESNAITVITDWTSRVPG